MSSLMIPGRVSLTNMFKIRGTIAQMLVWPLLGLLIVSFDELGPSLDRVIASDGHRQLFVFLQWGLLTPIVVQLAFQFALFEKWTRNLAIHVFAATALSGQRITSEPDPQWVFNTWIASGRLPEPSFMARSFSRDLLVYASIAVAVHLVLVVRRRWAEERQAASMRGRLAEAERALIPQSLSPGLIIRSFDEIAACIRHEPSRAEPLIERFGDFLRTSMPRTLECGDLPPLAQRLSGALKNGGKPLYSKMVLACAAAGVLAELPEAIALWTFDRLLLGTLEWALWGAVFAPIVYKLATRRSGLLWVLVAGLPVMLAYNLAIRSDGLFQPLVLYTLTGGYGLLVNNYQRKAAAEEDQREIEERFAAARVESLIRQLRPHFIFNSLNTVSALAGEEPAKAARIAEELRDLFRWSLDARQEVSLEDEISFLSKYVDVQKARFDERLRISFTVHAGVQRAAVPALILQPLVENAIRHGMTTRAGVEIGVHAERHDHQVRLRVINDGRAIPNTPLIEGVGLSNTRARLRAMYGQKASFDARARAEGGFEVEIRVPLR